MEDLLAFLRVVLYLTVSNNVAKGNELRYYLPLKVLTDQEKVHQYFYRNVCYSIITK